MRRLNGTIADILLQVIFPVCLVVSVFWIIEEELSLHEIVTISVVIIAIYFLVEKFMSLRTKTYDLFIDEKFLYIDKDQVSPEQVRSIKIDIKVATGYSYEYVIFTYEKNYVEKTKRIRNKSSPIFFDLKYKYVKTVDLLLKQFPELENRIIK